MVKGWKSFVYPPLCSYVIVESFNLGICWRFLQILLGFYIFWKYAQDPSLTVLTVEPATMSQNEVKLGEAYLNASWADQESIICQSAQSFTWSSSEKEITHRPSLCARLDEGEDQFVTAREVFIPTFSQDSWREQSSGRDCVRLQQCCEKGSCFGTDTRLNTVFKHKSEEYSMLGEPLCICEGHSEFFVEGPQGVKVRLSAEYSRHVPGIGFKRGSTFARSGDTPQYVRIPSSKYDTALSSTSEYIYKGTRRDQPRTNTSSFVQKKRKAQVLLDSDALQTSPAARTVRKEGRRAKSTASLQFARNDPTSSVRKPVQPLGIGFVNANSFTYFSENQELDMTLESWMEHAYSMTDDTSLRDLKPAGQNSILDAYNRRAVISANNRTDPYPTFRMSGLLMNVEVNFQNHEVHRLSGQNKIAAMVSVTSSPGEWQNKDRTYVISPIDPNTGKMRMMQRKLSGVRMQINTTGALGTWSISLFVQFVASTLVMMTAPSMVIALIASYLLSSASGIYYSKANVELDLEDKPFQLGLKAMLAQLTFDEQASTYVTGEGKELTGYTEEDLTMRLIEATRSLELPVAPVEMEAVIRKMFQLHDTTKSGVMTTARLSYLALGNDPYDIADASVIYAPNPVRECGDLSSIFLTRRQSSKKEEQKEL